MEIYRRYNQTKSPDVSNNVNKQASHNAPPSKRSATADSSQKQQILRETAPQPHHKPPLSRSHPIRQAEPHIPHTETNKKKCSEKKSFSFNELIGSILPGSIYNKDTKKLFGFLKAEDLLLIALILLFAENDEEDDSLMVLALIYILISDYINLPDSLI